VTILIIPINFPEDTKSGCRKILYLPLHKKTQTTFSEIVKDFNILNSEGRQGYETFYWHVRLIAVKIKHHLFFNCAFNKRKVSSWTLKNESGDLDALQKKKMFLDHVYFIQRRIDTFNKKNSHGRPSIPRTCDTSLQFGFRLSTLKVIWV
jgi:hypothetical protein